VRVYQCFDVDEVTPVQYAAIYIMHWRPEWGEPDVLFREVDDKQQALFDAAPALVEAAKEGLALLEQIDGGGGFDMHDARRARRFLKDALALVRGEAQDA